MENNNDTLRDDLSNYDRGSFEKPSVTVDVCVCTIIDDFLKVLLIKRSAPPFRGHWALPGGFVRIETPMGLEETALGVLSRETSISHIYLEQLKTYGAPDRDPRMRIITVAYFALVPRIEISTQALPPHKDAVDIGWFDLRKPPRDLAFDHSTILADLLQRLMGKISYTPIAFNLLPDTFTWKELQRVYEIVLGKELITPNFRRKIKELYRIRELKGKNKMNEPGRPGVYLKYEGEKKIY